MRTAKLVGLTLLAFFLLGLNSGHPVIGFNSDFVNSVANIVIGCLPIVALIFSIAIPKKLLIKIALPILLLPIVCVCELVCLLRFLRFTPYGCQRVSRHGYSVRSVVEDAGWGEPEVVVRQEKSLGFGLLLVRELVVFFPADSVTIRPLARDTVRVDVPEQKAEGEPTIPARSEVFQLKPHVYF
jgi:hypothetical protein